MTINEKLTKDFYWETPLLINPGIIGYPDVFHFTDILNGEALEEAIRNNGEISVNIEYQYTLTSIKSYSDLKVERWIFSLREFICVGPNGVRDEYVRLPGE